MQLLAPQQLGPWVRPPIREECLQSTHGLKFDLIWCCFTNLHEHKCQKQVCKGACDQSKCKAVVLKKLCSICLPLAPLFKFWDGMNCICSPPCASNEGILLRPKQETQIPTASNCVVLPAEHVDVVLSVNVGEREAAVLNVGNAQLESLLVLHTSLGKDHFITVDGTWGQSHLFLYRNA